ncbi:hypothetical protein H5V45_01825 [Nocardioides sp. KIGAM211]|uniref:Uncharacterized protein n=1 Tax=Nocardioides luti TaxID=2761101 RepID=A0A7X0RFE3_9ACTN|nr:hypothetical protein [Nocardioides luti]MBB6626048.1 hypothetical protein [Nocardioides luti]
MTRTPALLLLGAMGTGKSDTSYHVFSRLYRSGIPTARLDLDDIGMCHPAPPDDPDNFVVKAEAMGAAWRVFASHGARCLVVSGAIDTPELVDLHTSQLPDADWTVVRLRIGTEERRRRVLSRGILLGYTEAEMEPTIAAGDADERVVESRDLTPLVIDTDGLDRTQVADLVLARTGWPKPGEAAAVTA